MKPLETSKQVVTWLCGFPRDEFASQRKKIAYFTFALSVIVASILSVTASVVFIYKNALISLEETLFSLYHNIGACVTIYQTISTILLRHKFMAIFDDLTKIYDKSKHRIDLFPSLFCSFF